MNADHADDPLLCRLAWLAIEHGLHSGHEGAFPGGCLPEGLAAPGASFVTLEAKGRLRGCVGNLRAQGPLAESVHGNAYAAAFRDPRFAPLGADEVHGLEVHISVLSALSEIRYSDETVLLGLLRPGVDGLLIRHGRSQATFLPQVWRTFPSAEAFLAALKRKANLATGARGYQAWRYGCREVHCGRSHPRGGSPVGSG